MAKNTAATLVGRPLPRFETCGSSPAGGRFTDDFAFDRQAYALSCGQPTRMRGIRRSTPMPRKLPGVIAVFTAKDYPPRRRGNRPHGQSAGTYDVKVRASLGRSGMTPFETAHPPLAAERVRFVGEPVAIVIAETQSAAQDAAESVIVTMTCCRRDRCSRGA